MAVNPSTETAAERTQWKEWYGTVKKVNLPWSPETRYSKLSLDEWLECFRLYMETEIKLKELVGNQPGARYKIGRPTFYKMYQKYASWLVKESRATKEKNG